ncbi:hypothetical protein [Pandoraea commovens]|uniref:Uncharacterized protein n=1 Tax=Pandoraea commovens TaxID=2508289 RepID=A0A5E4X0V9_9BURK|nr:hypothetical protein [Pandoraea commovens]UVA80180.1 hypothetical protein NTU39_03900 [Pandoraea commovens]VVE29926.1 hypothetical protein PCO31010_03620 [Pandoraea commovens]
MEKKSPKDNFLIAQVAFCYFAVLNAFILVMALIGTDYSLNGASLLQKISVLANTIANVFLMTLGFVVMAMSLERCTKVVWRIALFVLIVAVIVNVLAMLAQLTIMPILSTIVSVAGIASLLYERNAVFGRSKSNTSGVLHG